MKNKLNTILVSLLFIFVAATTSNAEMKCGAGKCGSGMGKGMMKKPMSDYRAVPASKDSIIQHGKNKMYCPVCGMTLPKFYRTNQAATDSHGHVHQYCSIVCEVEDAVINGRKLNHYKVVDNTTLKFIDAKKAYYVVGSNKPATMSTVSKYAFGTLKAAQAFATKNGGKIMTFDEVYQMVKKSLKKEIEATKKRQAKAAAMGEKIYNKMCKKTDKRFTSVADAKTYLTTSGICGKITGKKHQMVALFLSGKK